jgi:hypothetical protein
MAGKPEGQSSIPSVRVRVGKGRSAERCCQQSFARPPIQIKAVVAMGDRSPGNRRRTPEGASSVRSTATSRLVLSEGRVCEIDRSRV